MLESLKIAVRSVEATGKAQLVEFSFASRAGEIDFLVGLSIVGSTLVLDDVCIYPRQATQHGIGRALADILRQKRALEEAARELGFRAIDFRGTRVTNSSSANPGKRVRLVRRVDK